MPSFRTTTALSKPIVFDEALITAVVRYGESDCIVKMFTKEQGRMAAFYKRGRAKKNGQVQAPAFARVGLVFSSKWARLTTCDLEPASAALASSLKSFAYASYFAELIENFLPEGDPCLEVFSLVEEAFSVLITQGAHPSLLRSFELKLLDYCGYLPDLTELLAEDVAAFDPIACRLVATSHEGSMDFSPQAVRLASAMLIAKIGSVNYEGTKELLMIGRLFHSRLKLLGLKPLKTVAFLKELSKT